MTRQFCDRCDVDVTVGYANVDVVGDADQNGNGIQTDCWDLCRTCYVELKAWIKPVLPTTVKKKP